MARTIPASLAEPMTAEETSMMDADRDAEHSQPEPEPESAPEPAQAAEPAKQPESALDEHDDEGPAIDPKTGQQRKVDYGALHAERQKRKAAESEVSKAREELAKFNGRWETLQQLARGQQQPQQHAPQGEQVPDINDDPVGHFEARARFAEQRIADVDRWRQSQEANATAMNNVRRLTEIAQTHEAEFSKATPDYQEAFQYVRQMRDQELEAMGYADPAQRQQIIQNDALQIAAQALQNNKNAAEVVYKIAKSRGFAGGKPPPSAPIPAAQQPDAQKIAKIAKGQEAGQSLGQVNGSSPAELSIEGVLKMSDKDFAKWATEDNFRKLAGG